MTAIAASSASQIPNEVDTDHEILDEPEPNVPLVFVPRPPGLSTIRNRISSRESPPHALAGQRDHGGFQVRAARVNVRSVAQSELQVDGRRYADQLRNFVIAHEPADVIGSFHIEVDGRVDGGTDGRNLRKR